MTEKTPTEEQKAIIEFGRAGKGNLIIEALAGCGKTETLLWLIAALPQRSILVAAFGKAIELELKKRMPALPRTHAAHIKTFHALGLGILNKHFRGLEIDKDATEGLVNEVRPQLGYNARRAAVRLLRVAKEALLIEAGTRPDTIALLNLGWDHNIFTGKMSEREISMAIDAMQDAYALGRDFTKRKTIDFCDMVWAPLELELDPPSRYQAIVVDELQDISEPQLALLRKVMLPTSRFIAAGDIHQQIYQFRGSMGEDAWAFARDKLTATFMPLTMTWRCSRAVVKLANELVPDLRARPDADEGSVLNIPLGGLPAMIRQGPSEGIHTYVLSRTNAELLDCALFLWRERVKFQLNAGKEMLEPLFYLLDFKLSMVSPVAFTKSLEDWHTKEKAKADKANAVSWGERIDEQYKMLKAALAHAVPTQIKGLLSSILLDNQTGVLLSTVHKVKGREAERVYLLEQTFSRGKIRMIKTGTNHEAWERLIPTQEELNIEYVGITRAREHLIWVDMTKRHASALDPAIDLTKLDKDALAELFSDAEREALRLAEIAEDAAGEKRAELAFERVTEIAAARRA